MAPLRRGRGADVRRRPQGQLSRVLAAHARAARRIRAAVKLWLPRAQKLEHAAIRSFSTLPRYCAAMMNQAAKSKELLLAGIAAIAMGAMAMLAVTGVL